MKSFFFVINFVDGFIYFLFEMSICPKDISRQIFYETLNGILCLVMHRFIKSSNAVGKLNVNIDGSSFGMSKNVLLQQR